ncbi:MAG TPA: hypothetical protein VFV75_02785 [Candidatus Polarisedimenticolaceae bacterium]|nr:hypothetical protein [Candidatus Polarisedimenticolaceae bacterium]
MTLPGGGTTFCRAMDLKLLGAGLVAAASISVASAGDLQRELAGRWRGSWVIVEVGVRSDCGGMYTNNRLNGRRVSGSGAFTFGVGELAQIDKVDLHRARLDVLLTLAEPMRVSSQDGPFTLYRQAACRVELQAELPRSVVAGGDVAAVERALAQALERHDAREEAERSRAWNARQVEPYPDDYEDTLAEHGRWKADQANAAVRDRIGQAQAETVRVTERIESDDAYLSGFAEGVERARDLAWPACDGMVREGVEGFLSRVPPGEKTDEKRRHDRGFEDGQRLVVSLELSRRLPGCFVSAP